MHAVAMWFAAGHAFFLGLLIVVAASLLRFRWRRQGLGAALSVAAFIGAALVLLSATPLPVWAYALWGLAFGATLLASERPLPPSYNSFGQIQRRYALQHGVVLIPKRCLAAILADPEATVDGIHLSRLGHERLAAVLAGLVE